MTAPHGTRSRYVAGCREECCRAADRDYKRATAALRRRCTPPTLVDAAPVIAHLEWLRRQGTGRTRIVAESGVPRTTVEHLTGLRSSFPARVTARNARLLLAVRPQGELYGDPTGTARRLRALVAIGHTRASLAAEMGVVGSLVSRWTIGRRQVTPETRARVVAVYDRLWQVFPTGQGAAQARADARRRGWPGPLAWDDATIDDPAARTDTGRRDRWGHAADEVEVAELVAGRLSADRALPASRAEAYARLFGDGLAVAEVAERVAVSERTAERARVRWLGFRVPLLEPPRDSPAVAS